MIKVTLGEVKTQEEKGFPKLMKTKDGYIVYFIKYGKGVCFAKPNISGNTIGEYTESWNMNGFTDYNEPITIQNA